MPTTFDFTYNLNTESAQSEALNALGKKRIKTFEPKSYFFTESNIAEQTTAAVAYGPENGNSSTRFNITTVFALTGKKAYAVTGGQVLIVPQDSNKVNVFIKPLKNVDIGVPIKYFVYRGLKKELFFKADDTVLNHNTSPLTPFMTKVWADLISFNQWPTPPNDVPASLFGFSTTEAASTRIDSKFFNAYADDETNANKVYNLPIVEPGQHFGEFADDNGGFEIVLNDGFYHQEKSDTGFELDMTYGRAAKVVLDIADIAANPNILEPVFRENVQKFLDPAAFYGAHITNNEKGEINVVNSSQKYKSKADIYTNIVSKFYNKFKCYLYLQSNRGRSFNFDNAITTDPIKIGVAGTLTPGEYQTYSWPIIIREVEQTHNVDESDAKKEVNRLSLQLKFKTINKNVLLYNSYGDCLSESINGNFLYRDGLINADDIATQEYTNAIDYGMINTFGISGVTGLNFKSIASFIYINHEEKEVEYFNDFFGPILLDPIAKVVLPPSENIVQKVPLEKKKIKTLFDNQFSFESNFFSFGIIQPPSSPGNDPIDDRTRLYVLRQIDSTEKREDKTELTQFLSTTTDYGFANTADKYFSLVFSNKDNRVWKGSFVDQETTFTVRSLQLVNLIEESFSKKFTQLGITEVEFNKVIYDNVDNTVSGHLPGDATNIFFHLDDSDITQGTIYKKYKLGVKYDTAGIIYGVNTEIKYPTSLNEVYVYTLDGHFFFTADYAEKCTYFEEFNKAAINFRPMPGFDGEFGFDWLRIGDNGDASYQTSIVSGYEGNDWTGTGWFAEFDDQDEAFRAMQKEYISIKTQNPDEIYYVPYLNIYPETYQLGFSLSPIVTLKAKLKVDQAITGLKLVYDTNLFLVSDVPTTVSLAPGPATSFDISIACKKEFNTDQVIKVIATSQDASGKPAENIVGLIKVCKNSIENRRKIKVVLVKVRTNIFNAFGNEEKGKFNDPANFPNEIVNLKKVLYQAYIDAEIEGIDAIDGPVELDLRSKVVFHEDGEYMDGPLIVAVVDPLSIQDPFNNIVNDVKQDYLKTELLLQYPDSNYKDYFVVYSFDIACVPDSGSTPIGNVQTIGKHSVCLYQGRNNFTLAHEGCHGFGLFHSHKNGNIDNPHQKYVFPLGNSNTPVLAATDNIMSYNGVYRKSTWRWQWQIMRENIDRK